MCQVPSAGIDLFKAGFMAKGAGSHGNEDSYAADFARKGGKARAKKLTAEQRKESARKAAQARWAKKKKQP